MQGYLRIASLLTLLNQQRKKKITEKSANYYNLSDFRAACADLAPAKCVLDWRASVVHYLSLLVDDGHGILQLDVVKQTRQEDIGHAD